VKAFDEWISELPAEEIGIVGRNSSILMIILHELDSNKVGIKGRLSYVKSYFPSHSTSVLI